MINFSTITIMIIDPTIIPNYLTVAAKIVIIIRQSIIIAIIKLILAIIAINFNSTTSSYIIT